MFSRGVRTSMVVCVVMIAGALMIPGVNAYNAYARWLISPVIVFINPQNADVSASAAEASIEYAMNVWNTEGGSNFRFLYGGRVNDTATGYDSRNVVLFRNASDGGTIASTYSWRFGDTLVDADVVFWDGAFTFVTGSSPCHGGAYIEDIAAHELGHVLGLLHSTDTSATMASGYAYCSQEFRSLAADDIAGVRALYGTSLLPANTAPTVSITSPVNNAALWQTAAVTFAGSASDKQDGNLTSQLQWISSLDGLIGYGGSFSTMLSAGPHVITASVTDSGNLTSSSLVSVTVSVPSLTSAPTLSATGHRQKRQLKVELKWSGFGTTNVDVYRNGALLYATANDGLLTDAIKASGGSFTYQLCGSGSATCSNHATVTF